MGAYNWTTLGRNPDLRWKPSHLYVRQIQDAGRALYKVGVGELRRSSKGKGVVLGVTPMPLAVAFVAEQQTLNAAGRVELVEPLVNGGSTEVVADLEAVWSGFERARSWAADCQTPDGRRQFDAEHFPGCVPADELRPSQLSLFAA